MKYIHGTRLQRYLWVALIYYLVVIIFMAQFQRHFIYFPDRTRVPPAAVGATQMEVITVQPEGENFSIEGWYQPPADPEKPVIVYFHGNAMTIPYAYGRVQEFLNAGYGVLLAEYRGYNGNHGKPTERGLYADADAYIEWLIHRGGIPEDRIVLYGLSLGSGIAVEQAARRWNIAGLILEAPYTSLVAVARRNYFFLPVDILMLDRYPNIKRIGKIDRPLLILHGQKDNVVPVHQGKMLFEMANQPKAIKIYPQGGHNDLPAHGAVRDTLAFLETLGKS